MSQFSVEWEQEAGSRVQGAGALSPLIHSPVIRSHLIWSPLIRSPVIRLLLVPGMELVLSQFSIYDDYGLFDVDCTLCFEQRWYRPSSPFSGSRKQGAWCGEQEYFHH